MALATYDDRARLVEVGLETPGSRERVAASRLSRAIFRKDKMQQLRDRLTYANVVATLALFLVLAGGTAVAAAQLGKNSVGSKQIKKGAVTPAKLSAAAKATLTGPTGATGAAGAQGPKGDPGVSGEPGIKGEPGQSATALWAVVSGGSGGLVRGSGVTSSHKRNTGEFEVVFDRDVSACSYQVTMATTPGDAVAEPKTAIADGVFVETFESGGKLADKTFYLAVFC